MTGTIAKCPLKRGACLWEVKMQCLYVTGTIAKCPLKRGRLEMLCLYAGGVCLQEVSTSRSFTTVTYSSFLNSAESNTVTMYGRGFEKFNSAESHSVRCGFKFNNTYRQGMLYCKKIMPDNRSLAQSNTFNPIQENLSNSAF